MVSEILGKAINYEKEAELKISIKERPDYHLSPRTGWMNDPNGFSFYNHVYHMFYQYHPFDTNWGLMYWGHAISKDLLHWEYLPVAIAPDQPYDNFGCFSGSAVALPDGRHLLMYTGVTRKKDSKGREHEVQTQCLAVGDGITYVKYEGNPVLTEKDLPEGASKIDFRDPKMWMKDDGTFACVIGSRSADGSGQILLFTSKDGFDWKFEKVLIANENRFGKMWECPDLFQMDGQGVLFTSPQDMLPEGYRYYNGNGTLCLIGSYDEQSNIFTPRHNQSIDYGIDFYAPQTVYTEDHKRVMIGWLQNWDTCGYRREGAKWFGQMSIPRELSIIDGKLIQNPIAKICDYRLDKVTYEDVVISKEVALPGISGRKIDLELSVSNADANNPYQKFVIRFAKKDEEYVGFSYDPNESVVEVDRSYSGSRRAVLHQRRCKVKKTEGTLKVRMILDRYSAEIFINDGEQAMSFSIYSDVDMDGISFESDGNSKISVVKYNLS